MSDTRWRCRCHMPDGTIQETYWITLDGAYAAEIEMEQLVPGTRCEVEPVEDDEPAPTPPP